MTIGERAPLPRSRPSMMRRRIGLAILLAGVVAAPAPVSAASDVLTLVYTEDLDGVLEIAAAELDSPDVGLARKLEVLRATAMVHMIRHGATGDAREENDARIAMQTMLRLDPDTDFVPGHQYLPAVHRLFGEVRRETFAEAPRPQSPTRIAVAPFYPYVHWANPDFDPEAFAAALPFMVASELEAIDGLTLLSREHLDVIASELDLASEETLTSAENRLELGRLLSASAFVYGAVHVNGDEVTLTIRWVPTETQVVETSWQEVMRVREGRDLLDLYHRVVTEQFLPRMLKDLKGMVYLEKAEQERQEQRRRDFARQGDAYLGYIASVARAIRAEEAGDPAAAAANWLAASERIAGDSAAGERAQVMQLVLAYDTAADPATDAGSTDH